MRRFLLPMLAALLAMAACSHPEIATRPKALEGDLWIAGADIVDVVTGSVARARDVRIHAQLIAEILPAGAAPASAIDGRGATLIPGLIDAHVHIGANSDPPWLKHRPDAELNLQRFLYCGVTTVFETGGMAPSAFELREEVAAGETLGPRIFTTGPMFTAHGGHPVPMLADGLPDILEWYFIPKLTRQVGNPAEARAAVDALIASKPDAIKIALDQIPDGVPVMSAEVATAVAAAARAHGVRTVAHIGTSSDAITAAEAGVAAWVHGVYRERVPDALLPRMAAYGIPMVPTLVVFESYGVVGRGPRPSTALERETVPADMLTARENPPADLPMPEGGREYLDALSKLGEVGIDNVRRLHAAGVVILAGSDTQSFVYHGPGLHRELVLLSQALPPLEVLRAATVNSARFLTQLEDPPFGVIAPGKAADLVLVEGDPLADAAALSRIRAVILGGRPIKRHAVNAPR